MMCTTARAAAVLLVLPLLAGGCALGYYTQAVSGQMKLMSQRQPIEELIADETTLAELKDRFEIVLDIRAFASDELGLPDNDSYREYADIDREYVVWNVFAAEEFSVDPKTWCFPVVGCVAYRGYFHQSRATDFAAGLKSRGYDIFVGGVAAYSTLGRFDDPVLSTMINWPDDRLAAVIFHELAHQILYVKNDASFSEAFATTVEEIGVTRWLKSAVSEESLEKYRRRREYRREFGQLIAETRQELRELYETEIPDDEKRNAKARLFEQLDEHYRILRASWGGYTGYDSWFSRDLNNAHLISVATYYRLVPVFQRMYLLTGRDLDRFYEQALQLAKLPKEERDAALQKLMASADKIVGGE